MEKKEQLQIIKTMNMLCRYLTEKTGPEVKYSERNYQVAIIVQALNKLKKL